MMKRKLLTLLVLLITTATGAWAQTELPTDGDGAYLIASKADWETFCTQVNGDNDYSGKTVKLTADITEGVTTMAGSSNKKFSGTFDGQGHTLNVNLSASGSAIAPFGNLKDATIQNLHVAGSVQSTSNHVSGLVIKTEGTVNILDVRVSTTVKGSNYYGGIIGHGLSATINLTGCVFDGQLAENSAGVTVHAGGFIGWGGDMIITMTDCLFAGTYTIASSGSAAHNFHPIGYYSMSGTITNPPSITRVYQTVNASAQKATNNGKAITSVSKRASTISAGTDVTSFTVNTGDATATYNVSGITAYATGIKYNDVYYAGNGDEVSLTLAHADRDGHTFSKYVVVGGGTLANPETDTPTLTMTDANQTIIAVWALPTDASDAYLIASKADWEVFCDNVNNGYNYSSKTVKLTENITDAVTTTLGSFAGIFDGLGHTLKINTTASPFRGLANGGVIKNLIVNGSVNSTYIYASGLVSQISGSVTVENCRVNVNVTAPAGYSGGIVGHCGSGNTITMRGCVYTGKITAKNSEYCGGLVGWCNFGDNSKANTVNLANCFFNGTFSGSGQFHPITIKKNDTKIAGSRSNCFYTFNPKSVDSGRVVYAGTRVYSITAGTDVTSLAISGTPTTSYDVSGLNIYSTALSSNGVCFAASGKAVGLALSHSKKEGYVLNQYTVSGGGTLANPDTNTPTLTMTAANQKISATFVYNLTTDESGAYLIASKTDWEALCGKVNAGYTFSDETVKLTADITEGVTTMAGTGENVSFQGTFDGQGHTLTLALGSANSPYSGINTAPFRYTKNATIQNLKMAGDIYVSGQFAGGIIRVSYGTTNITNCCVSTVIHSSYKGVGNHGGLVSVVRDGTLTITGCVFDGRLFTTNATTNCGGLVGNKESSGTVIVNNSLYAPNANIAAATGETAINSGAALSRNGGTFTNSYFTETMGTAQGKRASTITAGEGVSSLTVNTGDATATYDVSGITAYATGIKYNDVCYAGEGDEVSLTLAHVDKEGYTFSQYVAVGGGTLANPETNTPTLTMTDANAVISAVYNPLCAVVLNVTGNGGTATLMDDEYKPLSATDKMKEGEKFVLSLVKDDGYDFDVTFSQGGDAIGYLQEFSEEEYESYIAYAKANNISVPLNSVLMWVTMPITDGEDLTMTVSFEKLKTFTVLYQPTGGSPEEVWCRLGMMKNNVEHFDALEMKSDAVLADGTAVWSLKVWSAFDPTKIAFFTSKEAVEADGVAMSEAVVSQSSDSWTTISGGQYVLIGGNAKTIVAAFVADASNVPVFNEATVTFDAGENGTGATYQITVCPTDEQGNVTSAGTVTVPAAPTAPEGKQFVEWSVLEGTGQDKTEHTYHAGNTVSISENMVFSAVWNPSTVTATLNLNGGTGAGSTSANYGETLAIAAPTRNGFAFNGWTVSNGVSENGQFFGKGSPFSLSTPVTADLGLTAQWKHVHAYTSYPISAFGSALASYIQYNGILHVILCNCNDVQLVSHSFNSNGRCACGYEKPDASRVTFDISYVQWDNNSYIQKAKSALQNAKKNQLVSVCAPQNYSNMDFKKWQYSTDGGNSWRDLASYLNVSFSIPCNMQLRALYVARITVPQVELSARTYVIQSDVNGQIYKNNNILYQMNYKLPDGYTFLDAGVRMGDNKCISYYELVEKGASTGAKAAALGLAATVSILTGSLVTANVNQKSHYYVARENSVLDEMSAETLAKYMYECKPVNVNYKPDYWQANAKTKGLSGSVNTMPSLTFTLMNGGNHWIYAIGYVRYKKPNGKTEVIYTDALPATSKNIPNYTVTKKGQQTAGARMMNRRAEVGLFRTAEDNSSEEEDLDMSLVLAPETQLTVYVDGEWSANLSDSYGYGETATISAPEVSGKTFSYWEADGKAVSSSNPLTLTMNANTTLQAVYDGASVSPAAAFTSVTRSDDKISFQAIADTEATAAGIVYSTTTTEPTIGADGVTQVEVERINDATTDMPASVLDANNCWMLQIEPDDENTIYHARAYATVGGTTTYGDVKSVTLADLKSGIMMIANLEAFEQGLDVNIDEALKEAKTVADQAAADAVIAKIAAIGEVAYTPECKTLIDAARTAYDALTDAQKALVTNYDVLTAAEASYLAQQTITLADGDTYTLMEDGTFAAATYVKTLDASRVGKHHAWFVPFDYTITDDDLDYFSFYKINMIANAPNPETEASDDIWVFLKRMNEGEVLHANMPYVYRAKSAVENYEFTTANATLKAKETGVRITMMTAEDTYTLYGTYEGTTATAAGPFYYVNINGDLSLGNDGTVTVGAFRWIMRVESKFGSTPAYARTVHFFDGEDSETTNISEEFFAEQSGKAERRVKSEKFATAEGWYSLDGRRVAQPKKGGVYIVRSAEGRLQGKNGKKVVIK